MENNYKLTDRKAIILDLDCKEFGTLGLVAVLL